MDDELVLGKLESLRRCVDRVATKTPSSADALKADFDLQDIISVNLERAVQQCVDIGMHVLSQRGEPLPDSMAGVFEALYAQGILKEATAERLAKAVGFRNMAVHAYREINWDIVFSIVTKHLGDFRDFAAQVAKLLK